MAAKKKKLLLASTSTLYGQNFLEYLLPRLTDFLQNVNTVTFIPYARPGGLSFDDYSHIAEKAFKKINKKVIGLHNVPDKILGLKNAEAIYVGGGNTFVLQHTLQKFNLYPTLKEIITHGTPYIGTSAGANIAGVNMKTTNDMPITFPQSFDTLGAIPFNINPHYINQSNIESHMGETRNQRLKEFLFFNNESVLALPEGSWLEANDKEARVCAKNIFLFNKNQDPKEISEGNIIPF